MIFCPWQPLAGRSARRLVAVEQLLEFPLQQDFITQIQFHQSLEVAGAVQIDPQAMTSQPLPLLANRLNPHAQGIFRTRQGEIQPVGMLVGLGCSLSRLTDQRALQ